MSIDNKDESFELLVYEKTISELYHNKECQAEVPSAQINAEIMAMAKQQLLDNSLLLIKEQSSTNKNPQNNTKKTWQWPFSLVASVGILGILFISQKDYFINPSNVVAGDAGILNAPVMRTPDISQADRFTQELSVAKSFETKKTLAYAQKSEERLEKRLIAVETKAMLIRQVPKVLEKQMLDKLMLEDIDAKESPMSLSDMSKIAAFLKQELTKQNKSELKVSALSAKMQQNLFENLLQYQNNNPDFKITEKYWSVLSEKQLQQLKLVATKAVSEN